MGRNIVVVGAGGDVGRGVTAQLLREGFRVVAVGRRMGRLAELKRDMEGLGHLELIAGSVADEESAAALVEKVKEVFPTPDGVVVSVKAPHQIMPLPTLESACFAEILRANLITHLVAAKSFVPLLARGGTYLAIGGGMADLVVPGMGTDSICQAAQRVMFKVLAEELSDRGVHIHDLMLHSMIAGHSNRGAHHPKWITDEDVGRHVAVILQHPDAFPETVITLRSRKEAGMKPSTT